MKNKVLIKLINEEIEKYDYLNNDARKKEQEFHSVLNNYEFQKQFIVDSISNKNKLNLNTTDIDIKIIEKDRSNYFSINYDINVEYNFDNNKNPINIILDFYGDDIKYNINGEFIDAEWNKINIKIYSKFGDQIKFKDLEDKNSKIYKLFVKEYLIDVLDGYVD